MNTELRKKLYTLTNGLTGLTNGMHYPDNISGSVAPYGIFFLVTGPEANSDNRVESEENYIQFSIFGTTQEEAETITQRLRDAIKAADFSALTTVIVHNMKFQFSRDLSYEATEKVYQIVTQFKAILTQI